jgi:hypothetical protein
MLIGLDFDNTLVAYGHAFRDLAVELGLAEPSILPNKTAVRAQVRKRHDDIAWQRLQATIYGPEIGRGELMAGAGNFITGCRDRGINLVIVSHKSEFASLYKNCEPDGHNLRTAALGWMEANGFFLPVCSGGFGFSPGDVFFEAKRSEKIARINRLDCAVFVDDLPEVLTHADLNPRVRRILLGDEPGDADGCELVGPWAAITRHLLGRNS